MNVKLKLELFFILVLIYKYCAASEQKMGFDWSLYQKLQTLQIGLIQNKNLIKYINATDYSINDSKVFINDRTKAIRPYNTSQCIRDLIEMQKASEDENSNWAVESKQAIDHVKYSYLSFL